MMLRIKWHDDRESTSGLRPKQRCVLPFILCWRDNHGECLFRT